MLIRNHLLCPYGNCAANKRTSSQRIRVLVDEERNVELLQSIRQTPTRTKLRYEHKLWVRTSECPFCKRPVEVVIDETHNGRNISIRLLEKEMARNRQPKRATLTARPAKDSTELLPKRQEILSWSRKYDEDYHRWTAKEKELGDKFRKTKELTKSDLTQVAKWKFDSFPGRKKRILELIATNTEEEIRLISNRALRSSEDSDFHKVETLCRLNGIGPALASSILTFYDPETYGIFDVHVCRELLGKEETVLLTASTYMLVLEELRRIAGKHGLEVRTVEKALFWRNLNPGK